MLRRVVLDEEDRPKQVAAPAPCVAASPMTEVYAASGQLLFRTVFDPMIAMQGGDTLLTTLVIVAK